MSAIPQSIREDLECTICLEISVSPIQSCVNGHLVCAICFEKVKTCGICNEHLQPNGLAERLARKYEIEVICRNEAAGCLFICKSFDLMAHQPGCEYRPIQCFQKRTIDCKGQTIRFNEYFDHLQDHHIYSQIPADKVDGCKFYASFYTFDFDPPIIERNFVYGMKYDDKFFLLYTARNEFGVFQWITVIGGKREAEMYKYNLQILSSTADMAEKKNVEYKWTLPVLPTRHNYNLTNVLESGCFAVIHHNTLKLLWEVHNSDQKKPEFRWEIEVQIVKL